MENWGFCGKQKNCFPTLPSSSQALQLVRRHLKGRSEVSFDTLCLPKRVALLSAKSQKGQKSRVVTNHQQTEDQGKPLCELVQSHTNIKNHSPIQLPNQQRFTFLISPRMPLTVWIFACIYLFTSPHMVAGSRYEIAHGILDMVWEGDCEKKMSGKTVNIFKIMLVYASIYSNHASKSQCPEFCWPQKGPFTLIHTPAHISLPIRSDISK